MLVAKNCYLEKHPFGETSISKTENAVFIASLSLSLEVRSDPATGQLVVELFIQALARLLGPHGQEDVPA